MIYFRKILEYDPTFNGRYDEYGGYSKITLQEADPVIITNQSYKLDIPENIFKPIFSSPLRRAKQTANKYFQTEEIDILNDLREIKFDMHKLLSESEYQKERSNLVRERFIEAFINDELAENRQNIEARVNSVLKKLRKLEPNNYLVISHSFFLKIMECYLIEKELFKNPTLIKDHFNPLKKTFEFGKGFDVEL